MRNKIAVTEETYLEGQFLIAMPGMEDGRFARSVVFLCAHSDEGAMGFIVNQPQDVGFPDLLVQLGVMDEDQAIKLPADARDMMVCNGGPLDRSRGFVLHSDDYVVESSMPVSKEICLTATVDILRAISDGSGPRRALMTLGYSGWGAGQLEDEIAQNGWLTCPGNNGLLFDSDVELKYERALETLGIDPTHLSVVSGHA